MERRLSGKVAIVTGSSRGIGSEIIPICASDGPDRSNRTASNGILFVIVISFTVSVEG